MKGRLGCGWFAPQTPAAQLQLHATCCLFSLTSTECALSLTPDTVSVCSVRKLFNKTVAALINFQRPRKQQVAKWVINAKVSQVEKRQYPSSGHSGETYVTFSDNRTVKGLIHAATKLAELADRGRLAHLQAHIALLCTALLCFASKVHPMQD